MTRIVAAAIVAIAALAACATVPVGNVEVNLHCSAHAARVEYQGNVWRFEDPWALELKNSWTDRWPDFAIPFQLEAGASGPVAIDPDGSKWVLILSDSGDRPDQICI